MESVEYTYRILGKGLLGPWEAGALTVCLLVAALLLSRAQWRRAPGRAVRAALTAIKVALVLLLGWLLFQPSLFVRQETRRPGLLVLLADDSASMSVRDNPERLSDLLDLVELVEGGAPEGRLTAARDAHRLLDALAPEAQADVAQVDRIIEELENGFPGGPAFRERLAGVSSKWQADAAALSVAFQRLRTETADLGALDLAEDKRSEATTLTDKITFVSEKVQMAGDALAALAGGAVLSAEGIAPARAGMAGALADVRAAAMDAAALRDLLDEAFLAAAAESVQARCKALEGLSRLELVVRLIQDAPALGKLARKHRVRVRAAAAGAETETNALRADAQSTDFFLPLRTILNEHSRDVVTGIILFSDGRQNSFADLGGVLEALRARSIPVHTVAVGSSRQARDLALVDYRLPSLCAAGREAVLTVLVRTAVPKGTPFRVTVASAGRPASEAACAADGSLEQLVAVAVKPETPGAVPLTISVLAGEEMDEFPGNNSASDVLKVSDGRARCLIVADVPTWDVRYLLHAVGALPVRVETVLACASPKGPPRGSGAGKVPESVKQWAHYDLIVLAGAPFAGFSDKDAKAIHAAVAEKGCGLLLVVPSQDGPGYAGPLAAAFGWPAPGGGGAGEFVAPASLLHVPPLAVRPRVLDAAAVWRRVTPPRRLARVPQQGAVLLRDASGGPVLSYGIYGKGRCVLLGLGDAYRMREFDGRGAAARFFEETAALALCPPDEAALQLLPRRPVEGQDTFVFVPGAEGAAPALSWKQAEKTGAVQLAACAGGALVGTASFPAAGAASFAIERGGAQAQVQTEVLPALSVENVDLSMDVPLLEQVARETGGRFARLADFEAVADGIKPQQQVQVRVFEHSLWHGVLFLVLVVGLITLDYVLRRKAGMVL